MKKKMKAIEKFSQKYQISFQFWGHGNNNVFIQKNDVELYSSGEHDSPEDAIMDALLYLYRITNTPIEERII